VSLTVVKRVKGRPRGDPPDTQYQEWPRCRSAARLEDGEVGRDPGMEWE